MSKGALIIGIDEYQNFSSLTGSVEDALAIGKLLQRNDDGTINYDCHVFTSFSPPASSPVVTKKLLRQELNELFKNSDGDVLFYFSGHGVPTSMGGYLVTQDGEPDDYGLSMDELLRVANNSKAKSVLLIIDCCSSGEIGNLINKSGGSSVENQALLREGLTILTASRSDQNSAKIGLHGVFTNLVLGALKGGAADVRGRVSAASIYGYVEQALGHWGSRPLYKSHADHLPAVRFCKPAVDDDLLRELPKFFDFPESFYQINPSYEKTHELANPEYIALFNKFKILRNARLLTTYNDMDLYDVALESKTVELTPSGQFYWRLADIERI